MNGHAERSGAVLCLGLGLAIMLSAGGAWRGSAQEPERAARYSTNAADLAACRVRLNIIHGALQQYREQHGGAWPDKLSDLLDGYLDSPATLTCPYVDTRGGLRTWKKRFRDLASDHHTSYSYEFPPTPLDLYNWRGVPKKTFREFKEAQMKEIGNVVPVVRCLDHRPCLNLSVGAEVYESGEYWETNFPNGDRLLTVANVFRTPPPGGWPGRGDFPPRDAKAGPELLDLASSYNARLASGWQGFPGNDLSALTPGLHEFDGTRFDVRGVIQLRGTELPVDYPSRVTGIEVRRKCERMHFLHGVAFTYKDGTVQASYLVHYVDGEVRTNSVVYGRHIADWWRKPDEASKPSSATIAWRGENEAAKAYDMTLALYHAVWENPRKDTEIATITFDAGTKKFLAGPFVVAITLE